MANTTYQETNQFGEAQNMTITDAQKAILANGMPGASVAATSLLANRTGGATAMIATTFQQLMNALPAKAGVQSITAIATADANTQTGGYVQADVQSIATLANANKAKINEILAALKVVS